MMRWRRLGNSHHNCNVVPRRFLVCFTLLASFFSVSGGRGITVEKGERVRTTTRFDLASLILQRETMAGEASSDTAPFVASPFSLTPYDDSLPPQLSPSDCLNPPQQGLPLPQPPPSSSFGSGSGSGSDFPSPSGPALLPPPGPLTPIQPGPTTPEIEVPSPPQTVESPPTYAFPGPPSDVLPGPPSTVPRPPSDVLPGPPSTFPSPPSDVLPGPPSTFPSPPSDVFPGPPSTVPSPPADLFPGPPTTVPSPPFYMIPVPNTPPDEAPPALDQPSPPVAFLPPVVYPPPTGPPKARPGPPAALWCVAKPSVPDPIMQEAMNYACGSGADCESLQSSGSCFEPDTVYAHASYAFNSYWQRTKGAGGSCSFGGTAILVTVDPSYDGCHFVYY